MTGTLGGVVGPRLVAAAAAIALVGLGHRAEADAEPLAVADFTLKNLDARRVSLHETLATGPVVVAFWATWCKPCLQELPELSERAGAWAGEGLTTYAISIDKTRSHGRVRSYVRSQDFRFDVLLDPNQEAFRKLQGQSVPYLVLLDASGEAVYEKVGYRPGDEEALDAAVAELLGGRDGAGAGGDGAVTSERDGTGSDAPPREAGR